MSIKDIDTPCIGICSTIYGDNICRGCKRTYREVIDWNTLDSTQKQSIYQRLEASIVQCCQDKLSIIDPSLLLQQLNKFSLRHNQNHNPLCWAFILLREGHDKIQDLTQYGFIVQTGFAEMPLSELYRLIDGEILAHETELDSNLISIKTMS
jgi:predicted Fe-S protein YdhL (DUF1289 family)